MELKRTMPHYKALNIWVYQPSNNIIDMTASTQHISSCLWIRTERKESYI